MNLDNQLAVVTEEVVSGQKSKCFQNRLSNQQAVKWITMVIWKHCHTSGMFDLNGQSGKAAFCYAFQQNFLLYTQFSSANFYRSFPNRGGTHINFARVSNQTPRFAIAWANLREP